MMPDATVNRFWLTAHVVLPCNAVLNVFLQSLSRIKIFWGKAIAWPWRCTVTTSSLPNTQIYSNLFLFRGKSRVSTALCEWHVSQTDRGLLENYFTTVDNLNNSNVIDEFANSALITDVLVNSLLFISRRNLIHKVLSHSFWQGYVRGLNDNNDVALDPRIDF